MSKKNDGGGLVDEWLRMYDERVRMTPRTGYNVLILSEYDPRRHGEDRLSLVKHVETWEQAVAEKAEAVRLMGKDEGDLLIYPMKKRTVEPPRDSSAREQASKKDEFNPYHDPETGQFTSGDGAGGGGGGSGDGKTSQSPSSPSRKPVDFDTAFKNHDSFARANAGLKGYSYDPTANRGYSAFDKDGAANKADTVAMYSQFADGNSDLYLVGMTNHGGQLSRESQSTYIQLANENKHPLVGYWEGAVGFGYTDISFPTNHGTTDEDIIKILDANAQESALVIDRDGSVRFVNGSNVPVPKAGLPPIR